MIDPFRTCLHKNLILREQQISIPELFQLLSGFKIKISIFDLVYKRKKEEIPVEYIEFNREL